MGNNAHFPGNTSDSHLEVRGASHFFISLKIYSTLYTPLMYIHQCVSYIFIFSMF